MEVEKAVMVVMVAVRLEAAVVAAVVVAAVVVVRIAPTRTLNVIDMQMEDIVTRTGQGDISYLIP